MVFRSCVYPVGMVNWSEVSAIATAIYGGATLAFVVQIWRDRVQREQHFAAEAAQRKLDELRTALYDAVGYWEGRKHKSGDSLIDATQASRAFEAVTRLEGQLRLNGYEAESQNLGFAVRANLMNVDQQLQIIGTVLGLFAMEYRQVNAVGFKR
jgi:hypothetical protein